MRYSVSGVEAFAKCPKYQRFLQGSQPTPRPIRERIFEAVAKRCLMQATETGFRARWRAVVGFVDSIVFKDVDVTNQERYKASKQIAEHCLKSLQNWYDNIYMNEDVTSYVDLTFVKQISRHNLLVKVPILQLSKNVIVTIVRQGSLPPQKLYNDLGVRALAAVVQDELHCNVVECRSLGVGEQGGFDSTDISVDKKANVRVYKMLGELMDMMGRGISHPSVTQMCGHCSFYRRCRL
jgi:hypothetical protein